MRLEEVGVRGRRFAIQLGSILDEFGQVIPWLHDVSDLAFATNGAYFRDELMRRTRQTDGLITPFQFVEADAGGTFLGGILHFATSPEQLRDHRNIEAVETIVASGASFISCLQVRSPYRRAGIGREMTLRALRAIVVAKGSVWGAVSDPQLLPWYRSLGAETPSPMENKDDLWIVHWSKPPSGF